MGESKEGIGLQDSSDHVLSRLRNRGLKQWSCLEEGVFKGTSQRHVNLYAQKSGQGGIPTMTCLVRNL